MILEYIIYQIRLRYFLFANLRIGVDPVITIIDALIPAIPFHKYCRAVQYIYLWCHIQSRQHWNDMTNSRVQYWCQLQEYLHLVHFMLFLKTLSASDIQSEAKRANFGSDITVTWLLNTETSVRKKLHTFLFAWWFSYFHICYYMNLVLSPL